MSGPTIPSYNRLKSIWIKNEPTITATYGNVSLYTKAKTDLGQITTKNLAINKDNDTLYALDVSGNAYFRGKVYTDDKISLDDNEIPNKKYVDTYVTDKINILGTTTFVNLSTDQNISGTKTFTKMPRTENGVKATSINDFVTKGMVDSSFVDISTNQVINSVKTFQQLPRAVNGIVPTTVNDFVTKGMVDSSFVDISTNQVINSVKTFQQLPRAVNGIVPTTVNDFVTKRMVDASFVDISTNQVINSVKTFQILPQSSVTPSNNNELTTKKYVDDTVTAIVNTIETEGNYVTTLTDQNIGGKKTFTNALPRINFFPVPDNSLNLITKGLVDASLSLYALDNTCVKITGNQDISGVKTFTSLPKSNGILNPSSLDDFVTKRMVDSSFVDISTNQVINSVKTFQQLPQATLGLVPILSNQFMTKGIVDGSFVNVSTAQDISGVKTFISLPLANSSITTATNTHQFVTKGMVDSSFVLYALDNTCVKITGNQDISGVKTFTSLPKSNGILNPSSLDDFVTKRMVDSSFVDISTNQVINSVKTFQQLPEATSGLVPTLNNQFMTKGIVDGSFVNVSTAQNIGGIKTFTSALPRINFFPVPDSSLNLITKGLVDASLSLYALDNTCVKITGNQDISGNKTFVSGLIGVSTKISGDPSFNVSTTGTINSFKNTWTIQDSSINIVTDQGKDMLVVRSKESAGDYVQIQGFQFRRNGASNSLIRLTGTGITTTDISDVALSYLNGASSNIQTQINTINTKIGTRLDNSFNRLDVSVNRLDVSVNSITNYNRVVDASFLALSSNIDISNAYIRWRPIVNFNNSFNVTDNNLDFSKFKPNSVDISYVPIGDGSGTFLRFAFNNYFGDQNYNYYGWTLRRTSFLNQDGSRNLFYVGLFRNYMLNNIYYNTLSNSPSFNSNKSNYGDYYIIMLFRNEFTNSNLKLTSGNITFSFGYYKISFGLMYLKSDSDSGEPNYEINNIINVSVGQHSSNYTNPQHNGWKYYDIYLPITRPLTTNIVITNNVGSNLGKYFTYIGISPIIITPLPFSDSSYGNLITDGVTNSYISNRGSFFTNCSLLGKSFIEGPLTLTASYGTDNIDINSNLVTGVNGSLNINNIRIGNTLSPYSTGFNNCIMLGSSIGISNEVTTATNSIAIGTNISSVKNKDIIIGNNINKQYSADSSFNILIGNDIGVNATNNNWMNPVHTICIGTGNIKATSATTTSEHTIAIGSFALGDNYSDKYNTAIGGFSLNRLTGGTTGTSSSRYNTSLGYQSGQLSTRLNNCTFLGALSGSGSNTVGIDVSNATAVGYNAKAHANYATSIGSDVSNNIANSVRIGRPLDTVQIDGSLNLSSNVTLNTTSTATSITVRNPIDGSYSFMSNTGFETNGKISVSGTSDSVITNLTSTTREASNNSTYVATTAFVKSLGIKFRSIFDIVPSSARSNETDLIFTSPTPLNSFSMGAKMMFFSATIKWNNIDRKTMFVRFTRGNTYTQNIIHDMSRNIYNSSVNVNTCYSLNYFIPSTLDLNPSGNTYCTIGFLGTGAYADSNNYFMLNMVELPF